MQATAISRACELIGGQFVMAERVGVTPQAVSYWCRRGKVPAERVLVIEAATGGRVSRHELRPDLYPAEVAA